MIIRTVRPNSLSESWSPGKLSTEAALILVDLAHLSIDYHGPVLGGSPAGDNPVKLGLLPTSV